MIAENNRPEILRIPHSGLHRESPFVCLFAGVCCFFCFSHIGRIKIKWMHPPPLMLAYKSTIRKMYQITSWIVFYSRNKRPGLTLTKLALNGRHIFFDAATFIKENATLLIISFLAKRNNRKYKLILIFLFLWINYYTEWVSTYLTRFYWLSYIIRSVWLLVCYGTIL